MAMEVITAGALTTVQDLGRFGFAAQGFGTSGACDRHAMRLANALLGNPLGLAVLECTLQGPALRFTQPTVIAVAGAAPELTLNGEPANAYVPLAVQAGDTLGVGFVQQGVRCYIAVLGGVDLPPFMGSRSTDLRTHTGGFQGRAVAAGDVLPVGSDVKRFTLRPETLPNRRLRLQKLACEAWMAHACGPFRFYGEQRVVLVRAVPGPQENRFTPAGLHAFTRGVYRVAVDSNRMACKLEGDAIEAVAGYDIISDGIAEGCVQVAANGLPMVLLADHQTTGGYAKIATVIGADIPTLAQLRPGDAAGFCFVTPQEGLRISRAEQAMLLKIKELMAL